MSYSLSGSVITQASGTTNTDLSGLASITGVTVFNDGVRDLYILDNLQLLILGTQTINPFNECIFTQNWSAQYNVRNDGTLTINGYRSYFGRLQYSRQPWLISTENDNSYCFLNNGTFSWTGGAIHSKRGVNLSGTSVTLDTVFGDCVHVNRFQFDCSNLTINGPIELQGFRCSVDEPEPLSNLILTGASGIDLTNTAGRNNIGNGAHYTFTDFVYKLSDFGCNLRYNNTADFINAEVGSALDVDPASSAENNSNNGGVVAVYKRINFNVKDLNGNNLQGAKVYFYTYDDGNRVDVSSSFGSGFDFTGTDIFSLTTDASGNTATSQVLLVAHTLPSTNANDHNISYYSKNGDTTDLYTVDYYKYGYLKSQLDVSMKGTGEKTQEFVSLPDLSISEVNPVTVNAYTEIDTSAKLYDRAATYIEDNFSTIRTLLFTRSGNQIELTNKTLVIDATASSVFAYSDPQVTIKASTHTGGATATTGSVTTLNGAILSGGTFDCDVNYQSGAGTTLTNVTCNNTLDFDTAGTYTLDGCTIVEVTNSSGGAITLNLTNGATVTTNTGPNITLQQLVNITAPNILTGSRVQLYNVTKDAELDNSVASGSYSLTVNLAGASIDDGDTVRLRATYQSGVTAKAELETSGVISASGLSFVNTQVDNDVYNAYGVDGSTITEFSFDSGNIEVDINDSDNTTEIQRLACWEAYFETTEQGIRDFFGCIDWESLNSIQIVTSMCDLTLDNTKASPLLMTGGRLYRSDGATVISSTSNSIQIDYEPVYIGNADDITDIKATIDTNLDATVSSRASQISVDNLPSSVPSVTDIVDGVFDEIV